MPKSVLKTNSKNGENHILTKNYEKNKFSHKFKLNFQKQFNLDLNKKIPLILVVWENFSKENKKLLLSIIPEIVLLEVQLIIFSDKKITKLNNFAKNKNFVNLNIKETNIEILIKATDIILVINDDDSKSILLSAMIHGCVPIVGFNSDFDGQIVNYNPNFERGEGFVFKTKSPFCIYGALIRAIEYYKFPYDWKTLQKSAMILGRKLIY